MVALAEFTSPRPLDHFGLGFRRREGVYVDQEAVMISLSWLQGSRNNSEFHVTGLLQPWAGVGPQELKQA